jgi:hypothetical protein
MDGLVGLALDRPQVPRVDLLGMPDVGLAGAVGPFLPQPHVLEQAPMHGSSGRYCVISFSNLAPRSWLGACRNASNISCTDVAICRAFS